MTRPAPLPKERATTSNPTLSEGTQGRGWAATGAFTSRRGPGEGL